MRNPSVDGVAASAATPPRRRRVTTMHDDVPLWCDTCCCEPEPRWQRVAEELGLDDDADTVAEAHRRVAARQAVEARSYRVPQV